MKLNVPEPRPGRRRWLQRQTANAASLGLFWVTGRALAQGGGLASPTPAQTEGPFYPRQRLADEDADLVRVRGVDAQAVGTLLHVQGRVLDVRGQPLAGARVELWQADAQGIYRHPRAPDGERLDPGFQGYGQVLSDAQGRWQFRTIVPGRYPGRTPHLHFKVGQGERRLTTQAYFAGDPGNARDFLLRSLDEAERRGLTMVLQDAPGMEPGARLGRLDFVLG
jgi:protocatechuate 3,4-dioxygenase beta subunit